MTEEESGSVLGGLYDAASSAVDAVEDYGSSQLHAAEGMGDLFAISAHGAAGAADYFIGDLDGAAEHEKSRAALADDATQAFDQSGQDLRQAGEDVWGG